MQRNKLIPAMYEATERNVKFLWSAFSLSQSIVAANRLESKKGQNNNNIEKLIVSKDH